MNDSESDATPCAHLGFRVAVGAVGLAPLALLVAIPLTAHVAFVTATPHL